MYKFKFEITNEETGEQIATDWALFDIENIDQYGGCETIDMHTAAALRYIKRARLKRNEVVQ